MARKKIKLVTARRLTSGAERGQWMSYDWRDVALTLRPTRIEALRTGLPYALRDAQAVCADLSMFDTEVP